MSCAEWMLIEVLTSSLCHFQEPWQPPPPRTTQPALTCPLTPPGILSSGQPGLTQLQLQLPTALCSRGCQDSVHSCDQSVIRQNVMNHDHVLGRGPDAPGVTHHLRAWKAFLPLSLSRGLCGPRELGCTWAPSLTSCVITDKSPTLLHLPSSGRKECNPNVKSYKMMSHKENLPQCLKYSVKTRVSQRQHCELPGG